MNSLIGRDCGLKKQQNDPQDALWIAHDPQICICIRYRAIARGRHGAGRACYLFRNGVARAPSSLQTPRAKKRGFWGRSPESHGRRVF